MVWRTYFHASIILFLSKVALVTPFWAVPCLIICKCTIRTSFNTCSSWVIFILWSRAYSCATKIDRISIRKFIKKWTRSNTGSSPILSIIICCSNHRTHLNTFSYFIISRMSKSIIAVRTYYHTTPGCIISV